MSSAVARPIRSSSNTLTSSKVPSFRSDQTDPGCGPVLRIPDGTGFPSTGPRECFSDLFDGGRLEAAGQVDTQLFGGAVDVVVGVAHLDGGTVAAEHLDVQAERLQLLEQHLE